MLLCSLAFLSFLLNAISSAGGRGDKSVYYCIFIHTEGEQSTYMITHFLAVDRGFGKHWKHFFNTVWIIKGF